MKLKDHAGLYDDKKLTDPLKKCLHVPKVVVNYYNSNYHQESKAHNGKGTFVSYINKDATSSKPQTYLSLEGLLFICPWLMN